MGRGRFLNQKLGKRTSRKVKLLKARLPGERTFETSSAPSTPQRKKKSKNGRRSKRSKN